MSRVQRASITATFGYVQFALAIVIGIVLVPFVLNRVGVRLYGYWLASGEVLAYAAMADLGVLGVIPWMIAQADGRKDRHAIRQLLSTGLVAAVIVSAVYAALVFVLWHVADGVLQLQPAERAMIAGPLALIATVTAVVLPIRVAHSALVGLQDVRYCGMMTTVAWALDAALTVVLLLNGYGLWALAIGASVPSAITAIAAVFRLYAIAPELLWSWPRPSSSALLMLFREGGGGWLGAWGWRLASATDAIVLASIGYPVGVAMLATTAKLGQMLTNMGWVPGDSALVGLAQLAGEDRGERLRSAMAALFRVYLALGTVAACVVLAANPAFVRGWVGEELFAGLRVNMVLAAVAVGATGAHALATTIATLGRRFHVGVATLAAGGAHVVLAYALVRRFGLIGIPLAGLLSQSLLLIPLLLPALRAVSGLTWGHLVEAVVLPWARRGLPMVGIAAILGVGFATVPLWAAISLGAAVGIVTLYVVRHLVLEYPAVANLIRTRLATLRLDGLLLADPPQQPGP